MIKNNFIPRYMDGRLQSIDIACFEIHVPRKCQTQVEARLVEDRGTTWRAEVNGTSVVLFKESVHLSEELVAYWCHQGRAPCQPPQLEISSACGRCLFVAVGG